MSKLKRVDLRMEDELYQAIQDVAKAEGINKTKLILPILRDVFLNEPIKQKVIRVPVVGQIVKHAELGNIIVPVGVNDE